MYVIELKYLHVNNFDVLILNSYMIYFVLWSVD
jgi:hypothetical protein